MFSFAHALHNLNVLTALLVMYLGLSSCSGKFEPEVNNKSSDTPQSGTDKTDTDGDNEASKFNNENCVDPDLADLRKGKTIMLCDGTIAEGTLDLTNLAPGNIKLGVTVDTVTGTLTSSGPADCVNDGELACVTTAAYLAADMTNVLQPNIKNGVTIAGVAGNYTPDFPAVGNVLSTDTVNGVAGTLTLPAVGKVYLNTSYGVAGNGSTGTLTLPAANKVLTGSGSYGDPGSALTPSYSPDFPAVGNVLSTDTVNSVAGTLTLPAAGKVFLNTSYGVGGNGSTGTLTLPAAGNVLTGSGNYGDPGSAVSPSYSPDFPAAANVRSNDTTDGVTGLITDCAAQGSACYVPTYVITTQPLKAISFDSITEGIIKKNSVIAGITGDYPSSTYRLAGADSTDDLSDNAGARDAQLKSSTSFEWFMSDGTRATGSGDPDIVASNILDSASIFGTAGSVAATVAPDAWNIRIGQTVNGVTGKLKVACRNGSNPALYDTGAHKIATADSGTDFFTVTAHGYSDTTPVQITSESAPTGLTDGVTYFVRASNANTFQLAATSGGAAINFTTNGANITVYRVGDGTRDIWDTIDDFNISLGYLTPSSVPAAWTSDNYCGGVGTASGDEVWMDTTTGGCNGPSDECRFKDKITNLEWSETISTNLRWGRAVVACANLSFGGAGAWRLPTQKELMAAAEHGIYSAQNPYWITKAEMEANYFWSSTTASGGLVGAWSVYIAGGLVDGNGKTLSGQVICVR